MKETIPQGLSRGSPSGLQMAAGEIALAKEAEDAPKVNG
jgi:hypothetical protein